MRRFAFSVGLSNPISTAGYLAAEISATDSAFTLQVPYAIYAPINAVIMFP